MTLKLLSRRLVELRNKEQSMLFFEKKPIPASGDISFYDTFIHKKGGFLGIHARYLILPSASMSSSTLLQIFVSETSSMRFTSSTPEKVR